MANKAQIDVVGLKELVKDLKDAEPELLEEIKAANKEAADAVADGARFTVPRKTGKLRDSIRASGTARAGIVRAGKAKVPYAGPIHFGWPAHNIKPQPFFYEALDKRIGEVLEAYETRIKRVLDAIGDNGS